MRAQVQHLEKNANDQQRTSWDENMLLGLALLFALVTLYLTHRVSRRVQKQRDHHTKMLVKLNQERLKNQEKIWELGSPLLVDSSRADRPEETTRGRMKFDPARAGRACKTVLIDTEGA